MNSKVLTDGWVLLGSDHTFQAFLDMSDEEKRLHYFIDDKSLPSRDLIRIYKKGDNIVVGLREECWHFARKKFFIKRKFQTLATVTPKRVFRESRLDAILVQHFGLEWCTYLDAKNVRNILTKGKEGFVKPKPKMINGVVPIALIKSYTSDPNAMITRVETWNDDMCFLFRDMLTQAAGLNRIIKSEWSDRKIKDKHNDWSEEIGKLKARNCSYDPVYDKVPTLPKGVTFINSERQCADEGFSMHHCLYSNYWSKIKSKKYIALHVEHPEGKFTVGMRDERVYNLDGEYTGKITYVFEQAFGVYNKTLTEDQMKYAKDLAEIVQNFYVTH
jgi:hypothetical protein